MRRAKKAEDKKQSRAPQTAYEKAHEKGFITGYHEGVKYGSADMIRLCTTAFIATVKNELGFGKVRLERMLDMFGETIKQCQVEKDHEPYMRRYFLEKLGIDLDRWTGCACLDRSREYETRSVTRDEIKKDWEDVVAEDVGDGIIGAAINLHGSQTTIRGR